MKYVFPALFFWILSIWGEIYFFNITDWFQPNLFFLSAVIFCLHWRGLETLFISLFFGLTADCFSTQPFGVYGLTFFLFAFLIRWYAIKIFRNYLLTIPVICGFFTLIYSLGLVVFLILFFDAGGLTFSWLRSLLFSEVIPTAILAIPFYQLLVKWDKIFNLKLAERKF